MDTFHPHKVVKTDRIVTLYGGNASARGHLVDLSLEGVGVVSERGAREGTELDVEFELPVNDHFVLFRIHGKVTNRHNIGDEIYLHIHFEQPTPKERAGLQAFIDYKNRLSQASKQTLD